ncbi:hypothetical protein F5Y13DRAFT_53180 [Hypoxylon sp. FL1857]|nr:hypothetical protein F5Y13DRAFT_53180 [Hypoxylon sp. FL1857]
MRPMIQLIIAALCCLISADWSRWSSTDSRAISVMPAKTSAVPQLAQTGWLPKPTSAVGEQALDLREVTATVWTNSKTCGWIAGVSSQSFACDEGVCATNSKHIVACVSSTVSPFYSLCLDYDAFQKSSCVDNNMETGCCIDTRYPECATYIWTDSPYRYMYRCWSSSAVITMIDVPQFIRDASRTTASAEVTIITGGGSQGNPLIPNSGSQGSDVSSAPSTGLPIDVIVGTTIGGSIGLLILVYLIRCYRRQRKLGEEARRAFEARLDRGFQNQRFIEPPIVGRRYPDGRVLIPRHSNPRFDLRPDVVQQRGASSSPHRARAHRTRSREFPPIAGSVTASSDYGRSISGASTRPGDLPLSTVAEFGSSMRSSDNMPPPRYSVMNPYPEASPRSGTSSGGQWTETDMTDADLSTFNLEGTAAYHAAARDLK